MNRTLIFSKRTLKEIVRDPINLFFGLAFPVLMIIIMSIINKSAPVEIFQIDILAPGIAIFGLSFMSIFAGLIVAKDRNSAFLERLYTTPLRAYEMIIGYMLPLVPLSVIQSLVCYIVALMFGFSPTPHILVGVIAVVPISIFFISFGLLFGSFLNEKAVGSTVGSVLPVLTSILGGCWFDLDIMNEGFKTFAYCLPFANAIKLEKCLVTASYEGAGVAFAIVMAYVVVTSLGAILVFLRQTKKQ